MRKRPAWSWADYHREERKRREPPSGFLQLLIPHLRALPPDQLKALAKRAGVTPGTLDHWLSGRVQHGHGRTLTAIARELGYELVETPKPQLRVARYPTSVAPNRSPTNSSKSGQVIGGYRSESSD